MKKLTIVDAPAIIGSLYIIICSVLWLIIAGPIVEAIAEPYQFSMALNMLYGATMLPAMIYKFVKDI